MSAWIALALLVLAGLALVLRPDAGTIAGLDAADFATLAAGLALLVFIGLPLLGSYRGRLGRALRDFVMWALVAFVLVAAYSYRHDLLAVVQRVSGELLPPGTELPAATVGQSGRAVRLRRRSDGHFIARVHIDNATIDMIVDTGASTVVLRPSDARRIGIDTRRLSYTVPVQTANGTSFAARVRLPSVFIGPVGVRRVEALVAKPGALHQSLLGMSFLSRLRSYEFSGDYLTLRS